MCVYFSRTKALVSCVTTMCYDHSPLLLLGAVQE